ncbi:hypothetical protein GCM10011369_07330 [Neiella marina]|uniref:FAD-dependent oxidoreductase n=1 Tax=Neiella marina TaxID=508461 RepID=A0A8J2U2V4_9GAMM|nr:FAD-dependent oxidoreductase [Neiella marina]GGA68216.1 hypothetical protein GCM10011369_07330 [Neiella marina]
MTRVAVIGAGIAGLTAAKELQSLGYQVDVFEKSRGRGGRLASKRLSWATVDTGAQYFTARHPRFRREVSRWVDHGAAQPWQFTPHKLINGELHRSPDDTERFVGTPNMNSIAHQLATDLNLNLNITITSVERRNHSWYLTDQSEAEWGAYHWLVVAIPPAQARYLLAQHMSEVSEQEPLLLPCWATVLATKGAVCPTIQGVFGDKTVSWLSRLSAKPGRVKPAHSDDVWLLHFSPQHSADRQSDKSEQIIAEATSWLTTHLDSELAITHEYAHFWRYAHMATPNQQQNPNICQQQQLAVVGDWCQGGRIEGAYLSATNMVREMIA